MGVRFVVTWDIRLLKIGAGDPSLQRGEESAVRVENVNHLCYHMAWKNYAIQRDAYIRPPTI